MPALAIARTTKALRRTIAGWREAGQTVALVPTMGALHEGHLSLVRLGRRRADRVVVSIFVNPTQFAPTEDFAKYPRTLPEDRRKLAGAADLIFAPAVEEMYPDGFATTVSLAGPAEVGLDDVPRPTHFKGVATVVAKLLIQALPDVAIFGEKDYQQLKVVERLVRDLHLPLRIVPAPTMREADGLAMSSRNRYLSAEERPKAAALHASLRRAADLIRAGRPISEALAKAREMLTAEGFQVDYVEGRDSETLEPVRDQPPDKIRLLAAARLGSVRLIDNIPA